MFKKSPFIFLAAVFLVCLQWRLADAVVDMGRETRVDAPKKVFKAGKDWKEIQPDEAIPKGLHVRINMQTGKREAKILDPSEETGDGRIVMVPSPDADEGATIGSTPDAGKPAENHTLKELLDIIRRPTSNNSQKRMFLKEIEYLLHQYDVAVTFVNMKGIHDLVMALRDSEIREDAALALAAASQGNPKVQTEALARKAVPALVQALQQGCLSQCVFALSALIRQSPEAQQEFIELGGPKTLAEVYRSKDSDEKTRIRIISLLGDLMVERRLAMTGKEGIERMTTYENVILLPHIVDAGFCDLIPAALTATREDVREKVLRTLHELVGTCDLKGLVSHLESLRRHYKLLMHEENPHEPDEYFHSLYVLTDDLISHITISGYVHNEL